MVTLSRAQSDNIATDLDMQTWFYGLHELPEGRLNNRIIFIGLRSSACLGIWCGPPTFPFLLLLDLHGFSASLQMDCPCRPSHRIPSGYSSRSFKKGMIIHHATRPFAGLLPQRTTRDQPAQGDTSADALRATRPSRVTQHAARFTPHALENRIHHQRRMPGRFQVRQQPIRVGARTEVWNSHRRPLNQSPPASPRSSAHLRHWRHPRRQSLEEAIPPRHAARFASPLTHLLERS